MINLLINKFNYLISNQERIVKNNLKRQINNMELFLIIKIMILMKIKNIITNIKNRINKK